MVFRALPETEAEAFSILPEPELFTLQVNGSGNIFFLSSLRIG